MGVEPVAATAVTAEVMAALATPAGQADPYPHYARLRAIGPAVTGPGDVVVVVGHRACVSVLRDHRLAKSPGLALAAAGHPDWGSRPSLRMMFGSILMLNRRPIRAFAPSCPRRSPRGRWPVCDRRCSASWTTCATRWRDTQTSSPRWRSRCR